MTKAPPSSVPLGTTGGGAGVLLPPQAQARKNIEKRMRIRAAYAVPIDFEQWKDHGLHLSAGRKLFGLADMHAQRQDTFRGFP